MNQYGMKRHALYPVVGVGTIGRGGKFEVDVEKTQAAQEAAGERFNDLRGSMGSQAVHAAQRDYGNRTAGRKREAGTGTPFVTGHVLKPLTPAERRIGKRRRVVPQFESSRARRRLLAETFNGNRKPSVIVTRTAQPKGDGFDDARLSRAHQKRQRKGGAVS